jgi:hypothetical protein
VCSIHIDCRGNNRNAQDGAGTPQVRSHAMSMNFRRPGGPGRVRPANLLEFNRAGVNGAADAAMGAIARIERCKIQGHAALVTRCGSPPRSVLRAVINTENDQTFFVLAFNSMHNDIWQARHGDLAGARQEAFVADQRKLAQQVHRFADTGDDMRGRLRITFGNIVLNSVEMASRAPREAQLH